MIKILRYFIILCAVLTITFLALNAFHVQLFDSIAFQVIEMVVISITMGIGIYTFIFGIPKFLKK